MLSLMAFHDDKMRNNKLCIGSKIQISSIWLTRNISSSYTECVKCYTITCYFYRYVNEWIFYQVTTLKLQNFWKKALKGKDHLGYLDADGTIILKWILKL